MRPSKRALVVPRTQSGMQVLPCSLLASAMLPNALNSIVPCRSGCSISDIVSLTAVLLSKPWLRLELAPLRDMLGALPLGSRTGQGGYSKATAGGSGEQKG
jgi:hypothetical protein